MNKDIKNDAGVYCLDMTSTLIAKADFKTRLRCLLRPKYSHVVQINANTCIVQRFCIDGSGEVVGIDAYLLSGKTDNYQHIMAQGHA